MERVTIELEPEMAAELRARAARRGRTLEHEITAALWPWLGRPFPPFIAGLSRDEPERPTDEDVDELERILGIRNSRDGLEEEEAAERRSDAVE